MKRTNWIVTGIGAALMALVAGSFLAQQTKAPSLKEEVALRGAIEKETVQGDLKGAIEQYKKLAQSSNHAIAAQALIHMGESYELLGSSEAGKQYDLVIRKFPDQKDAVAQARAHLGGAAAKTNGMAAHAVWESDGTGDAAVSPDGRYISFNDDSGNLSLHDLSTKTDRRLTNADSKDDYVEGNAFSPDGKQIAYAWYSKKDDNYSLRILSLSGTSPAVPRVLLKSADFQWYGHPAWSPDEKWLAVNAAQKGKGSNKILLVSVQDGTFRVVGSNIVREDMYFSPDGKYLAYSGSTNGTKPGDVFVLPVGGGPEYRALDWPSDEAVLGWSRDGHVLFSSDRDAAKGLWALSVRDGKSQGAPTLITPNFGNGEALGLTAADALYYHAVTSGSTLAYFQIAPFDWNTGRILSPTVTEGPGDVSGPPSWSKDGKYFEYSKRAASPGQLPTMMIRTTATGLSRELGSDCLVRPIQGRWALDGHTLAAIGTGGLCLIDAQTGQVSKIDIALKPGESIAAAQLSSDQKKVYCRRLSDRSGGDGSVAFIEKDLATGNQREITRRPTAGELSAWQLSPDGRSIIVVSHDVSAKSAAVLLIPIAGGEPKELFRLPEDDLWLADFSPDGKYIRTTGWARNHWTPVWFIPAAGSEPQKWLSATPPLVVTGGFWAPDSKSVFLRKTTMDGEQTELWRVPVGGGQAVKLDINMNLDHNGTGPYVSPDGSQIAILREENTPRKNEIWVLENFLSSIPAAK